MCANVAVLSSSRIPAGLRSGLSCSGNYSKVPELPDVEGFRRTFARHAKGKRVHRLRAVDRGMLRNSSPAGLGRALSGRRFASPRRHGKLLICRTDVPAVLLHFGMTGTLVWSGDDHRHDRLVLELDDGDLHFRDMRRLGGIWLARDHREVARIEGRLGPDWLDVSRPDFDELLAKRRGSIKATLMDQSFAAGLGNLTADESLWQARIDPRRRVAALDQAERDALHRKIQKVLRDSLPYGSSQASGPGSPDRETGGRHLPALRHSPRARQGRRPNDRVLPWRAELNRRVRIAYQSHDSASAARRSRSRADSHPPSPLPRPECPARRAECP